MKNIFFNQYENRLRAGWRIALFVLVTGIVANIVFFGYSFIFGGRPAPGLAREFLAIGTAALTVTLLIKPARRILDRKSVISLGLEVNMFALKDLVFGWILSGVAAAIFFGVLWQGDMLTIQGFNVAGASLILSLGGYFLLHTIVGYWEELFFRGYLFDNLKDGLGLRLAIFFSCVLYGLAHAINPNASILSTSIIVLFGLMRLYGLLTTRQLWLSIGMHMGWNFFQGPVFGFAASGHQTFRLISHSTEGPTWLTGGDFGPEASVITIPLVLVSMGIMYWWSRRPGRPTMP